MKCAILAIGTELCLGQITNRNASWLAQQLHELGLFSPWHRVVPDDRELIHAELEDLSRKAEVLIVTGGLGPTTDDFTRDCIAHFLKRKLVWHENSWTWIQERLTERGIPVREIQKQQCYYPEGAIVIPNSVGTAHGFRIELLQGPSEIGRLQHIFVLPGPPLEVKSVFDNGVRPTLLPYYEKLDPLVVRSWDCLGRGESEVAHKVEAVLKDCPFTKAYRVHLPYVEFKLSFPVSRQAEAQLWCNQVEIALKEWTALRDGQDAVTDFLKALERDLQPRQIWIEDALSEGHLWGRLATPIQSHPLAGKINLVRNRNPALKPKGRQSPANDLELSLHSVSATEAKVFIEFQGKKRCWALSTPYRSRRLTDRQKQYFVEAAFLLWAREISSWLGRE